jgi:CDP-diacylglycerol--serine O-phosphatidyltransferase
MVSSLKFHSLKALKFRIRSFEVVFLLVVGAIALLYGAIYYFAFAFAFCSWGYILVSLGLAIGRVVSGKKVHTVGVFDPDPDDRDDKEPF